MAIDPLIDFNVMVMTEGLNQPNLNTVSFRDLACV